MSGTITSGIGLVSGINTSQIIDQLISIDSRPKTLLQNRIDKNKQIMDAFAGLKDKLSKLNTTTATLVKPSTFLASTAQSSNPGSLTATAGASAAVGQYQFTVAKTVTSQSMISSGYADATTSLVGAGVIKIGLGGGEVTSSTSLADLNGGAGVRRGMIRITDKAGGSTTVDLGSTVSLDDVIKKINTADNIQVKASLGENGLQLEDTSGGSGLLKVAESGGGSAAKDLGILGTSTLAGTTITGTSINTVGRTTTLSSLNDGLGVRTKSTGVKDFRVTTADGSTVDVSIGGKKTLGDVIDAINTAAGGKVVASVRADGKGLKLTDTTTGGGSLAVTAQNGSKAAADLGLTGTSAGGILTGDSLRAGLGSVLLKNLNGGAGVAGGEFTVTDRAGNTGNVDITGAKSLSEVVTAINLAGTGLTASVNDSGTGLKLTDTSGGTGSIVISDTAGTSAAALGIAGTVGIGSNTIDGGSLNRQFINENSLLSDLNGGKGIGAGTFKITDAAGHSATIDTKTIVTGRVQDLIDKITASGVQVTASINSTGSGLLLTDTSGGSGAFSVKDQTGGAAASLNLQGTVTGTPKTLDGAYVKTINVTATDTLTTLAAKINQASGTGTGVSATIINDGSSANPYRLSLTAQNTGLDGRFTFDTGATSLGLTTLVSAQNAAVFLGGTTSANPVLLSSSSNTLSNVVGGITLNLVQASTSPVTISVTQSPDNAVTQLKSFVDGLNELVSSVDDLTKFDSSTATKGLLLGDDTANSIEQQLFKSLQTTIAGAGRYKQLSEVGVSIGADNEVSFDEDKFRAAYATDATAVQRLFTAFNTITKTTTKSPAGVTISDDTVTTAFGTTPQGTTTTTDGGGNTVVAKTTLEGYGIAYLLQKSIKKLIDPTQGAITQENKSLTDQNTLYTSRIKDLQTLLDKKKLRLQTQFANMESVLSSLQNQQSSISKIQSLNSNNSNSNS